MEILLGSRFHIYGLVFTGTVPALVAPASVPVLLMSRHGGPPLQGGTLVPRLCLVTPIFRALPVFSPPWTPAFAGETAGREACAAEPASCNEDATGLPEKYVTAFMKSCTEALHHSHPVPSRCLILQCRVYYSLCPKGFSERVNMDIRTECIEITYAVPDAVNATASQHPKSTGN